MVAKAEELVARLKSADASARLKAVREVKNQVIGNRPRKKTFIKLNVIPRIVELLSESPESYLQIECATVVGSLARLDQNSATEVLKAGGFELLLKMLDATDATVIEAGLRALNYYLEAHSGKPSGPVGITQHALDRSSQLLDFPSNTIRGQAATFIFHCAHDTSLKERPRRAGVMRKLTDLVSADSPEAVTDPALNALCSLPGDGFELEWHPQCVARLLERLKTNVDSNVQLLCCACVSLMCGKLDTHEAKVARRKCLTVLARLISEGVWRVQDHSFCPFSVLCLLIPFDDSLRQAARDSGILHALAQRMSCPHCALSELKVPMFTVVWLLIEDSEEGRRQLLELGGDKAVQRIVEAIRSDDHATKLAGFSCMRGLSRSASYLRQLQTSFRECVGLCVPLLSPDQPADLRVCACALLSNLLLSFSPAREVAYSSSCIEKLSAALESEDAEVAYYALFALGNAARHCKKAERARLMKAIKNPQQIILLSKSQVKPELQVRALTLLQNLTATCTREELFDVVKWMGLEMVDAEYFRVPMFLPEREVPRSLSEVQRSAVLAGLNICNNFLVGMNISHKLPEPILATLADRLAKLLHTDSEDVTVVALLALTSVLAPESPDAEARVRLLSERQLWTVVEELTLPPRKLEVRDRARMLLEAGGQRGPTAMQED